MCRVSQAQIPHLTHLFQPAIGLAFTEAGLLYSCGPAWTALNSSRTEALPRLAPSSYEPPPHGADRAEGVRGLPGNDDVRPAVRRAHLLRHPRQGGGAG